MLVSDDKQINWTSIDFINILFLDMSSRQRLKATNDIFEMISENDEDIKFDECGILKPVTVSKSTIVIVCSSREKRMIDRLFLILVE